MPKQAKDLGEGLEKEALKEIWDDLAERILDGESVEKIQSELKEGDVDFTKLFYDDVDEYFANEEEEEFADEEFHKLMDDSDSVTSNQHQVNRSSINPFAFACYILGISLIVFGASYFYYLFESHSIPLIIPKYPIAIFTIGALITILGVRIKKA